jgi:hypothetical protein
MLILSKYDDEITAIVKALEQLFPLRNLGPVKRFLRLEITRDATGISINHARISTSYSQTTV